MTYVIVKDGIVLSAENNRETQLKKARIESGIDSKIPLGDVELWECSSSDAKLIWMCTWESSGPLEPNIHYSTPSLIPDDAVA